MRRTLAQIAQSYDTDKALNSGYISNFERHFGHLRDQPVTLLELGVFRGGSLQMWQEYFPKGLIVGLDLNSNPLPQTPERVRFYQGSQDDGALLARIARECAPAGFDIVIDDASHIGSLSRASFRAIFPQYLKAGGIYVVEDWGTGYWGIWPDGQDYRLAAEDAPTAPSTTLIARLKRRLRRTFKRKTDSNFSRHNFGMVGFVKELVDEVAWPDIASPTRGNRRLSSRPSTIREVTLYTGHAFVVKA